MTLLNQIRRFFKNIIYYMYYVISACPENCYKISFFTKSLVGRGSGSRPSLSPAGFRPKAWLQKISSPSSRKPSLSRGIQAKPGRNITSHVKTLNAFGVATTSANLGWAIDHYVFWASWSMFFFKLLSFSLTYLL